MTIIGTGLDATDIGRIAETIDRYGDRFISRIFTEGEIADICASFQRVVIAALVSRTFDAARRHSARSIGVAGGVSANSRLREEFAAHGQAREMPTFVPSLQLSTDNAAMIAAAGLRKLRAGVTASFDLNADAGLRL